MICRRCGAENRFKSVGMHGGVKRFRCRDCGQNLRKADSLAWLDYIRGFQPVQEAKKFGGEDVFNFLEHVQERQDWAEQLCGRPSNRLDLELTPDEHGIARLIVVSDLHLGNRWTDYASFAAALQTLIDRRYHIVLLGDLMEGFIRPIKGNWLPVLEQIISVDEQLAVKIALIKRLRDEGLLMGMVTGNHDDRSKRLTGTNFIQLADLGVPVVTNRAEVTVSVGGRVYNGIMAHKLVRGRSIYNPTHEMVRELREACPNADFMAAAHTHIPAISYHPYCGRLVPMVKSGSFNSDASYATEAWGKNSFISCPVLHFSAKSGVPVMVTPGIMQDCEVALSFKSL